MRVPSQRQHVRECTFTRTFVADDGDHVEIQRDVAVEPCVASLRSTASVDADLRNIARGIASHLAELGRDTANVHTVLRLVDDLPQAGESTVSLDPAIFFRGLRMMVLKLPQFIVHIVGVAALDTGLPAPEPFFVLFLCVLGIFPEEEVRLRLVRRPEDIGIADEPFFEERICCRIN